MINFRNKTLNIFFLLLFSFDVSSQEFSQEFLDSLPDEVRSDLISQIQEKSNSEEPQYRSSSTFIEKPDEEDSEKDSVNERFGSQYFSMMQSTFMPVNEANFDPNYILDFGDVLQIQLIGQKNEIIVSPIMRDGSISLPELGNISLAGKNLEDASKIIKSKFALSFIGIEAFITLKSIRDVQVLVAGDASYPGPYTLNGNSNVFHALSVSGGPSKLGSFRKIDLIRNGEKIKSLDLYQTFLFGDNSFGPRLRSGDTIFINPAEDLILISGAVKRPGRYELTSNETLETLVNFANGFRSVADLNSIRVERIKSSKVSEIRIDLADIGTTYLNDEERVIIKSYPFREVSISGAIKNPGTYRLNQGDGILELINRSGGYETNAYPFGGILINKNVEEISNLAKEKLYSEFLSAFIESSSVIPDQDLTSSSLLLDELRGTETLGRVSAIFDIELLEQDKSLDTKLMDGDEIIIPEVVNHLYVFGEISNEGTSKFYEGQGLNFYINAQGGFSENADFENIFVLHPNGVAQKLKRKNIFRDGDNNLDLYPGSIIFVPRKSPSGLRAQTLQAYGAILGNLGVTLASLSVLKD